VKFIKWQYACTGIEHVSNSFPHLRAVSRTHTCRYQLLPDFLLDDTNTLLPLLPFDATCWQFVLLLSKLASWHTCGPTCVSRRMKLISLHKKKRQVLSLMQFLFISNIIGFGGLEVACWPLVPKFTGSNRRIFKGEKKSSVNPLSHVADLRHVKISRITWKSNSRRNSSEHFSPKKSSTFRC
jgi:hypothetical protein